MATMANEPGGKGPSPGVDRQHSREEGSENSSGNALEVAAMGQGHGYGSSQVEALQKNYFDEFMED